MTPVRPAATADPETSDGVPRALAAAFAGVHRLGVAFSGGVDSSVLLAAAARTLGADRVVAMLGVSPSLAADERAAAHDVARLVGVPVVEVETHEGDRPEYRANGADRCFHCKDELFTRIGDEVAAAHRLDAVAYGENADDARRPDRPGSRAATKHRVLRPLGDAGLDKAAVRRLARAWGLPSADKPAAPCLASRIPHYSEVTPEKLAQIEPAEAALRRARLRRPAGPAPRRHRPDRAAGGRPGPGGRRAAAPPGAAGRGRGRLPLRRPRPGRDAVRRVHPHRAARGIPPPMADRSSEGGRPSSDPLRARNNTRERASPPWTRSPTWTGPGPSAGATRRRCTARGRRPSRSG